MNRILVVPYMSERERRRAISRRRDVVFSPRPATYRERFKGMNVTPEATFICPHMHRTQAAAWSCRG